MAGFTKLFSSIITSSIWGEDDKTRIMWITMLATADAKGHVDGSIPGMATMARMSLEDGVRAIRKLESPDPYSRSEECEGRRISREDGGWRILNYVKYREKRDDDVRKEYQRKWDQENRPSGHARKKQRNSPTKSDKTRPGPTQAEAEAEEEEEKDLSGLPDESIADPVWSEEEKAFEEARKLYPSTAKRGHETEWGNFKKKHRDWKDAVADLVPAIQIQIRERELKQSRKEFVPPWKNFQTWINQRYWEQAYHAEI